MKSRKEYIEDTVKYLTTLMKRDVGGNFMVSANFLSSWWSLIAGQSYRSFSRIVYVIEPMLYIDWMQWEGLTAVKETKESCADGLVYYRFEVRIRSS